MLRFKEYIEEDVGISMAKKIYSTLYLEARGALDAYMVKIR
jgi:hypothetical protein